MRVEAASPHRVVITAPLSDGQVRLYVDLEPGIAPTDAADAVRERIVEREAMGVDFADATLTVEGPDPQPYVDALADL